jgi:hypothetical protein
LKGECDGRLGDGFILRLGDDPADLDRVGDELGAADLGDGFSRLIV